MDNSRSPAKQAQFAAGLRGIQNRLYAYVHSLVRDFNDADDLFQQTTLVLWKKFDEFDSARSFFAWSCGIARLEVINFLRSRGRQKLYFTDELNLMLIEAHAELTDGEDSDRREALARCVTKLRERDQELLLECYQDGDGVHHAAEKRGRSPQSVYNSLRRIRRGLYECISRTLTRPVEA